jgi:hypothetical protein
VRGEDLHALHVHRVEARSCPATSPSSPSGARAPSRAARVLQRLGELGFAPPRAAP